MQISLARGDQPHGDRPQRRDQTRARRSGERRQPLPPPRHQRPARGPHHASPRGSASPQPVSSSGTPGQKAAAVRNAPVSSWRGEGCSTWACGPTSTSSTSISSGSRKTASGSSKRIRKTTDRAFGFSVRHGLQRYPGNRAGRHEHHPLGINPKTGNTLIADIRNASKTPENPVEASIQSLIKRAAVP